jgi:hypothetical protein
MKMKKRFRALLLLGGIAAASALLSVAPRAAAQTAPQKAPVIANRTGTQIQAPLTGASIVSCTAPGTCGSHSITGPCTITGSGRYYLSSDVTQSSKTTDAIQIKADHVTLDLDGHRISGPSGGTCMGIDACPSRTCHVDITVRNGTVTNFGGPGMQLGAQSNGGQDIVRQVKSWNNGEGTNGGAGITLGDNSIADYNVAYCNGWEDTTCSGSGAGDGLDCGDNCVVIANVADSNAGNGIVTGVRSNLIFNSASNSQTNLAPGTASGYCNNVMYNASVGNESGGNATCTNLCSGTGGTC